MANLNIFMIIIKVNKLISILDFLEIYISQTIFFINSKIIMMFKARIIKLVLHLQYIVRQFIILADLKYDIDDMQNFIL